MKIAGETEAQYIDRLESELETARERLDRHQSDAEREAERLSNLEHELEQKFILLEFMVEQLNDLALWITSPAAPRTKQQMARLIAGLLRGEAWRNGGWKR